MSRILFIICLFSLCRICHTASIDKDEEISPSTSSSSISEGVFKMNTNKPPIPADHEEVVVGGGLTGDEVYPAHVRVLEKKEVEREEREMHFKYTKFLVKHASPGCQEELDDVMSMDNSTQTPSGRSSLFSEECDEEFEAVSCSV